MNFIDPVLQASGEDIPSAITWGLISVLSGAFMWFLNRSVVRQDRSNEKLESTMNDIKDAMTVIKEETIKISGRVAVLEEKARQRRRQ